MVAIIIPIVCVKSNRKDEIVKTNSKMYSNIKQLNSQYNFFQVQSEFNFSISLNSLQKLNQFSLYSYVINNIQYSTYYKDIFYKVTFNIEKYNEYLSKYRDLLCLTSPADFDKMSNIKMNYKSFISRETKLYNELRLDAPTTDITFHCQASYTSPAGRNHHFRSASYSYKDLKHLFRNNPYINSKTNNSLVPSADNKENSYKTAINPQLTAEEKIKKKQDAENNRKETVIKRLSEIIKVVNKFEKDEKLLLIVSNFLKQENIKNLELFAIPKKKTSWHLKPLYNLKDIENTDKYNFDKIRYTLTASYKKYESQKVILDTYSLDEKSNNIVNHENLSVERLYKTLIAQNIIKNEISEKEAFYFLLSEKNRENKLTLFEELSEKYDIHDVNGENEIIEKLYSKGISTKNICLFIALKFYTSSEYELYADCLTKAERITNECLEEIKQKAYIDRLLTGKSAPKITLSDIDLMSGFEFESFIGDLFEKMGYTTKVTKSSGDQGIDVLATKNDFVVAIQAKCYSGIVGNHAIMEAVAGMKFYKADKCMVITNSSFTKSAQELAKANEVELWDRQVLKEKLEEI